VTQVVKEIWRYPVKSMAGEALAATTLTAKGVPLDRAWAVRDEKTQTIRGAKHMPRLMMCAARYIDGSDAGRGVPHVEITLPDGGQARTDRGEADQAVSDVVGRAVTLWPLQPPDAADHYRNHDPASADLLGEWRRIFTLEPDEPMPDLSAFGADRLRELAQFVAPRGTYFDVFPINILTEASLRWLQARIPAARLEARRFRPNLLLADDAAEGLVEDGWVGGDLDVGAAARLRVVSKAPRCVMTSHAQADLERDPTVIRTIVRELQSCFSVYAEVVGRGAIAVGDAVTARPAQRPASVFR
jgi:hypothetical protein